MRWDAIYRQVPGDQELPQNTVDTIHVDHWGLYTHISYTIPSIPYTWKLICGYNIYNTCTYMCIHISQTWNHIFTHITCTPIIQFIYTMSHIISYICTYTILYTFYLYPIHAMYSNIYIPLIHCMYTPPNVLYMHINAHVIHTTYAYTHHTHTLRITSSRLG